MNDELDKLKRLMMMKEMYEMCLTPGSTFETNMGEFTVSDSIKVVFSAIDSAIEEANGQAGEKRNAQMAEIKEIVSNTPDTVKSNFEHLFD